MRGTGFAAWVDIPVFETGFPIKSVTDLLNPAKAARTPTEHRTKPIKTCGLKKADREKELFCIAIPSSCASDPVVRELPYEKRVRWLSWSPLTDLTQRDSFTFADERQALIRVFLVRPSVQTPRKTNGRTNLVRCLFADASGRSFLHIPRTTDGRTPAVVLSM